MSTKNYVYIDKMMDIIKEQLLSIMSEDPDFYSQYNIILSNEQQYIKNKDRNPNNIYIVVKFMSGSVNFGQTLYPVNFNALGEGNKLDVAQRLLLEYAQTFNLGEDETWNDVWIGNQHLLPNENGKYTYNNVDYTIDELKALDPQPTGLKIDNYIAKQIYTQPQVMSNFNTFTTEFRSLFYMSGTFLIGKNSMPITKLEYYSSMPTAVDGVYPDGETINFITSSWDFSIQLDSQAFYGTNSRTQSKSKIGTLAISFTCYATDSALCNKIRGIAFNDTTLAADGIKTPFFFRATFASGYQTPIMEFRLHDASSPQSIGELPMMSLIFTN